jgi:hypothetical protein
MSMKTTQRVRLISVVCGIVLSLVLASCAGIDQKAPMTDKQFAADWREHARPLIYHGPGIGFATTDWMVPNILPRGSYQVIERDGDTAKLVDGYRFIVDGSPEKDIHLMLSSSYVGVEALNEKYIPSLAADAKN